jgi:ATP/ADP translocase
VLVNSRNPGKPGPTDVLAAARDRYTQRLIVIAVVTALVGVLIEFQFYMAAATSGQSGRENARFFSSVYFVLSLIGLVVQIYVMPRVQNRIGIQRSLLILPSVLLGAVAPLLVNSAMLLRSLLRVTEGGLKSSIHRSNWEQAYIALPRIRRPVAKILVDGGGARLGEGLAAGILQIWLSFKVAGRPLVGQDIRWVSVILVAAVLVWIGITRGIGKTLTGCLAVGGETDERLDIPLPET